MNPTIQIPTRQADQIAAAARRYRNAARKMEQIKAAIFKPLTPVSVQAIQYKGPGRIAVDGQCGPDLVPVLIPNGNVWWYPIETVTPAK